MTYKCRACGSENIVKNGRNKAGNAQYHGKDCGAYRVLVPKSAEQPERRRQVLQVYRERASLRGLGRIFGVARQSVLKWLADQVEQLPSLVGSLLPRQAGDILELDEVWAFVYQPISATTNAGCGKPCVGVLGKSSLLLSGIAALPPADGCGKPSRPLIAAVAPTPTSGRLIKRSCPNAPIILWARKPVRQLTRNVGILRFVSVSLVLFVKRCRSPSRSAIMSLLPVGLSFNTISVLHRFGLKASA